MHYLSTLLPVVVLTAISTCDAEQQQQQLCNLLPCTGSPCELSAQFAANVDTTCAIVAPTTISCSFECAVTAQQQQLQATLSCNTESGEWSAALPLCPPRVVARAAPPTLTISGPGYPYLLTIVGAASPSSEEGPPFVAVATTRTDAPSISCDTGSPSTITGTAHVLLWSSHFAAAQSCAVTGGEPSAPSIRRITVTEPRDVVIKHRPHAAAVARLVFEPEVTMNTVTAAALVQDVAECLVLVEDSGPELDKEDSNAVDIVPEPGLPVVS